MNTTLGERGQIRDDLFGIAGIVDNAAARIMSEAGAGEIIITRGVTDLVARTAVDIGLKALKGDLPANYPKLVLTKPDVITKENVDKYYRKEAVF